MNPFRIDRFEKLISTMYSFTAKDRLVQVFGQLELPETIKQQTDTVKDRESYNTFLEKLPSGKQVTELLKKIILSEYDKHKGELQELRTQRDEKLQNPGVDQTEFINDLSSKIEERMNLDVTAKKIKSKQDIEQVVQKALQEKLIPGAAGFRKGDIVEVTDMINLDLDTFAPQFYYSGDETDVAIGTKGMITSMTPEKISILISTEKSEKKWELHPDEISYTGVNKYESLISKFGSVTEAATHFVDEVSQKLLPAHIEAARQKIRNIFDAKEQNTLRDWRKQFNLSDKQVQAITQGKKFKYQITKVKGKKTPNFDNLARFFSLAISYDSGKRVDKTKRIRNETEFRNYTQRTLREVYGDNAENKLQQLAELIDTVITKEYQIVHELHPNKRGNTLDLTLSSLLDFTTNTRLGTKQSTRRILLYNDTSPNMYTAEPFSPPSEELERVLKLEMGNGCDWAKCTYCTEYGQAGFFVRDLSDFKLHIARVKEKLGLEIASIQRLFLAGGNIFNMPAQELMQYVITAKKAFHNQPVNGRRTNIRRIASFGRTEGLKTKTVGELDALAFAGLNLVFWGVETGADSVLKYVRKGTKKEQMIRAGRNVPGSEMDLSIMLMPGLGGIKHYEDHVIHTAELMNEVRPRFITFLSINPKEHSRYTQIMDREVAEGTNRPLTDNELVEQMYDIVSRLEGRHNCLVAAYRLPVEHVATNPIEFRGRLQYGGKHDITNGLIHYFSHNNQTPSLLIPTRDFNRDSPLRKLAKQNTGARV